MVDFRRRQLTPDGMALAAGGAWPSLQAQVANYPSRPVRAHRAAWLGAGIFAVIIGTVGVTAAIAPALWMNLFTQDTAVRAFGASYLQIVGAFYGFCGFGLALFFASQGAGRMF